MWKPKHIAIEKRIFSVQWVASAAVDKTNEIQFDYNTLHSASYSIRTIEYSTGCRKEVQKLKMESLRCRFYCHPKLDSMKPNKPYVDSDFFFVLFFVETIGSWPDLFEKENRNHFILFDVSHAWRIAQLSPLYLRLTENFHPSRVSMSCGNTSFVPNLPFSFNLHSRK